MLPIRDLNPVRTTPFVTLGLIALNVGIFFLWQLHGANAFGADAGSAFEEAKFFYAHAAIACELSSGEPLTRNEIVFGVCSDEAGGPQDFPDKLVLASSVVSMFLHGGLLHVLGNMWFLYLFGNNIEDAYGHVRYLGLYLAAGIVVTLGFVFLNADETAPLVGASGAIAGILGGYLVLFPTRYVLSLVFVVILPIPAAIFLGVWFILQFAVTDAGVAREAHVIGFLFGVAITLLFRAMLNRRLQRLNTPF